MLRAQGPEVSLYPITEKPHKFRNKQMLLEYPPFATADHVVAWERTGGVPKQFKYYAYVFDRRTQEELFKGEIKMPAGTDRIKEVIINEGVPYIIYEDWDNKAGTVSVWARRTSLPDMGQVGSPTEMAVFRYDKKHMPIMQLMQYRIKPSPDRSKWVLYQDDLMKVKNEQPLGCWVVNGDFTPRWGAVRSFAFEGDRARALDVGVSNDGTAFCLMRAYRKQGALYELDPGKPSTLCRIDAEGMRTKEVTVGKGLSVTGASLVCASQQLMIGGFARPASTKGSTVAFLMETDFELEPQGKIREVRISNPERTDVADCSYLKSPDGRSYLFGAQGKLFAIAVDTTGKKLWEAKTAFADFYGTLTARVMNNELVFVFFDFPKNIDALAQGSGGLRRTGGYMMEPAVCTLGDRGKARVHRILSAGTGERDILIHNGDNYEQWAGESIFLTYAYGDDHVSAVLMEWK